MISNHPKNEYIENMHSEHATNIIYGMDIYVQQFLPFSRMKLSWRKQGKAVAKTMWCAYYKFAKGLDSEVKEIMPESLQVSDLLYWILSIIELMKYNTLYGTVCFLF